MTTIDIIRLLLRLWQLLTTTRPLFLDTFERRSSLSGMHISYKYVIRKYNID